MIIGDIVYNDTFDFNANYAIYKCDENTTWDEAGKPIFSTKYNGYGKPLATILDLKVKYVTIRDNTLIIEV